MWFYFLGVWISQLIHSIQGYTLSKKSSWEAICLFHSCWLLLIWFGGFSFIIAFWNGHFLWNCLNGILDKVRITQSHVWWKGGLTSQIISISPPSLPPSSSLFPFPLIPPSLLLSLPSLPPSLPHSLPSFLLPLHFLSCVLPKKRQD